MQMLLLLLCVYGDYWNSKQKAKQYTENLSAKLQNSNQNSTFSWVSLFWTLNNPVQEDNKVALDQKRFYLSSGLYCIWAMPYHAIPDDNQVLGLDTSKATLHVTSAREIWIDQPGFNRREKLHFLKSDNFSDWRWY